MSLSALLCSAAKPSTSHLQFYIVNKVGDKWKEFCRYMQIKEEDIGIASVNNHGNVCNAMMEALHKFSDSAPDPPFNWLSLLKALRLLGKADYAEKLQSVICRGQLDPVQDPEIA